MEPIAVTGIGCRFPGAHNVGALWELLRRGTDALRPVPQGRYLDLNDPEFGQSDMGQRLSGLPGGFLEDIEQFDPAAFNISPREARVIDPQQRLLLETTWEALDDAGQDMRRLVGASVGVYVGVWGSDYQARLFRMSPEIDIAMTTGGGRYAAAGRLSFAFGFQGPSLTIDTACSSSLVAVHMACQALRAGECTLAIAGGANVILDSAVTIGYLAAGALSPDGRCKFGDASANGYVRSEGAGVVVLKTLRRALADKDPIHAIIRGSAVTHNGQTGGSLLAPGEEGQLHLLREALSAAGLAAAELDYIEAHGTGTRVGDRMELRALGKLLAEGRTLSAPPCLIGSIKTNIGHTESAAGIAGLIKGILCLQHREVPPSLHYRQPNPDVPWKELPLRIATERTPFQLGSSPAFVGVNSFGITGTFAHVILESAPAEATASAANGRSVNSGGMAAASTAADLGVGIPTMLPLSARSRVGLAQLAGAFAERIQKSPQSLPAIAFTAAVRRTHHETRLAVVDRDPASFVDSLAAFAKGEPVASLSVSPEQSPGEPCVGWVFSGQGPQWAGMGRKLFDAEPGFRATMQRLEPLIQAQTGWSLLKELNALGSNSKLDVTAVAQPAIFAIQVALAELLQSWGLRPAMIVGHSVGEAAAACVAGVLTLEDAVRVICARARIAERASGLGKMAAVELTVDEAHELLAKTGGGLSLAAINGPRSLTISGAVGPLRKFCDDVAALGRFCRVLDVNYPFHSALLDPLLPEMALIGENIPVRPPHTPLYSTVYGRLATASDMTAGYWPLNLRETVQFAPAIEKMAANGCNVFVEISPHPVLGYSIRQALQSINKPGCVVETLRRQGDEPVDLRKTVGDLYVQGCDPDWSKLVRANPGIASLPSYPWQRESYWIDEKSAAAASRFKAGGARLLDPLLQRPLRTMGSGGGWFWESDISLEQFPWLAEHRVQGRPVFPAAAYLLPALKAAGQILPGGVLSDIELHEALFILPDQMLSMQFCFTRIDDDSYELAIYAGHPARPDLARKHLSGRVLPSAGVPSPLVLSPSGFAENGTGPTAREAVYAAMHRGRLDYGPAFRGVDIIRHGRGEALARLTVPPTVAAEVSHFGIHPATLDACIQTLVALTPDWSKSEDLWMPLAVREISLRKLPTPGTSLLAWAIITAPVDPASGKLVGDIFLLDNGGEVLLAVRGLTLQKVARSSDIAPWMHEIRWKSQPLARAQPDDAAACIPSLTDLQRSMSTGKPTAAEHDEIRAALAELNRIGGLSVQRAFVELGFALTPGRVFGMGELVAETAIVPQHRRLLARLLQILCEEGVVRAEGDRWRVEREPAADDLAAQLRSASSDDPGVAALWKIFSLASLNLAGVLAGRVDAVQLLFGGDGAAALEQLYSTCTFWLAPLRQLALAVSAIVERLSAGRRLRVLEIGAGTGGLTSQILPLLPVDRTEYVFTDLSGYFLSRAQERFAGYPLLVDRIFDVERDPLSQGFAAGSFDLILAANCLHATRNMRESLTHVRQLLAPGGCMLLQEETAVERWTDLIFGLTDGWWRFDDVELRPQHALLSPRSWLRTLQEQGFAEAAVVGGNMNDACGSAVVLARMPDATASVSDGNAPSKWLLLADTGGLASQLSDRLRGMGQNCMKLDPTPGIAASVAGWLAAEDVAGRTVVDLRPLDAIVNESDDAVTLAGIEQRVVTEFLDVAHTLTNSDNVSPPRLVLVTRQSQATGAEQTPLALAQAPLWTIARVATLEHPRLPIVRIDLDSGHSRPTHRRSFFPSPGTPGEGRGGGSIGELASQLYARPEDDARRAAEPQSEGTNADLPSAAQRLCAGQSSVLNSLGVQPGGLSCSTQTTPPPPQPSPGVPREGAEQDTVALLLAELLAGDGEPEVAYRGTSRLVPRLHRLDTPDTERLALPIDQPSAVTIVRRGALDGVEAQPTPQKNPGPNEVQIRVAAAGMNFRDVLNVLGAIDSVPLGLECSGTVTAIGADVRDFAVGDQVIAAGLGSWRTYFNTPAALVAPKPPNLRHEQAAALPIAYLTAHYALRHVIQLKPKRRLLIHSAAGGVGLAAVYMALAAGAEVYGTAGSDEKRDVVRALGVRHVFDSRSLHFADQIRQIGDGEVDVVLNCFSGEFIPKSLGLLSRGGSFLEIGKRDIWTAAQMAEHRPDVKYEVLELAQVMRNAPQTLQPMLRQLSGEFASGNLPPLPIRAFPFSHVVPAMRYMQQGRHTGKIVLKAPAWGIGEGMKFAAELSTGSWLITGGFGGLGLAVARWLVEQGARQLILIGRRAPQEEALSKIEQLRSSGTRVLAEICDVANQKDLAGIIERGQRELSPLRGVFHLAGVLDDGPLQQLDWPRFATVYGPKALGAWNLHRLTRDINLDCFMLFSSWTALLGSPGQANHASANTFLDALAHYRRAQGLPAQAIDWGGWREVGSAARPERLAHLARQGFGSMAPAEALAALGEVMRSDVVQVGVSPLDVNTWRASNAGNSTCRFTMELADDLSDTAPEVDASAPLSLREALQEALPGLARRQVLEICIQRHLARVLRMPSAKFDVRKSFKSLGLDSLTSLELRNYLEVDAQLKLPAALVYNHATIASLATELAGQLGVSLDANTSAIPEPLQPAAASNDDELAALLGALQELPAEEAMRLLATDASPGGKR
jgi:acyl transferase domain-containing protein/NADPH:quinone reductase-like Zn-dependent oxidoreductase/acyl carrier protein